MERMTVTKFQALLVWGWLTFILSLPVVVAAWLLNVITGGIIQQALTVIAAMVIAAIGTFKAFIILMWTDLR